mgnify:CR=1 FL=1
MKRFDDALIVTDLDGTLYENQNHMIPQNEQAIEKFMSLGGHFTFATGRGISTARPLAQKIKTSCPAIANNGHSIYDYQNNKLLFSVYLSDAIKSFTKEIHEKFPKCGIEVYCDEQIYVLQLNDVVKEHLHYEQVPCVLADFEEVEQLSWSKLLITDAPEQIDIVRDFAKTILPASVRMIFTSRVFTEFVRPDTDKGTAVRKLAQMLGVSEHKIYTIGNYYNDLEMIQSASIGACVADAPADLKQTADYVTKKTCAQGGFAEFVEYVMGL